MAEPGHRPRLPEAHDRCREVGGLPDRLSRGAPVEPRRKAPVSRAGIPADRDSPRILSSRGGPRGRALPRARALMDERTLRELEIEGVARLYGLVTQRPPAAAPAPPRRPRA